MKKEELRKKNREWQRSYRARHPEKVEANRKRIIKKHPMNINRLFLGRLAKSENTIYKVVVWEKVGDKIIIELRKLKHLTKYKK